MIRLRAGPRGIKLQVVAGTREIFSPQKGLNDYGPHPTSYSINGEGYSAQLWSGLGVKQTPHLHLVPKLIISGVTCPFSPSLPCFHFAHKYMALQPLVDQVSRLRSGRSITFSRAPLNEWSVRRKHLYQTTHNTHKRHTSLSRWDSNLQSQQASHRRPTP